jgi:NADPH-dependent 2,4-dienoyl-CoA reductase/sulfur reductase-like enzyme
MTTYKCVILGGGVTAGYAAQKFADETDIQPGDLAIFSDEETLPYERPPLSKGLLLGETEADEILVNEPEFYRDHNIDVHLNTHVDAVDLRGKTLQAGGDTISFDKLLIATGARLRTFADLGAPGADLEGIHYLRHLPQAHRIRSAAKEADRAVVIGGSFIAMEVASGLQQMGVETTMIFPEERVWQAFFTPQMSEFFSDYYREQGVEIMSGVQIERFVGDDGVTGVALESGETLDADMVVAGIGVEPNAALFADSGLKVDDGILVNRYLETNFRDIFAAGDVARYRDLLFDTSQRVEHWDNAQAQGQLAACVMLGEYQPFVHVPYFFSDVFDLSYEFWGDAGDAAQAIHRGDVADGSFSTWWLKDGRLQAAFVMDRPEEEREKAPDWIEAHQKLDPEALADAVRPLAAAVVD